MSDPSTISPDEARAAELLARWLDGPQSPDAADAVWAEVREGLEPEVVEAVVALRPELAPAPQVDLESLLDGLDDGPLQPVSAEEAAAAAALADWLDQPEGDIPEDGLEDDVLEALHALRPDRAPAPQLDLDAVLGSVGTGPLASGGPSPLHAAPTIQDGSELAAEPAPVVDLAAARAARMPRWMLPGAGLIAMAATALLFVLPTADEAMQGAAPAEAPAHMDEARPDPAPRPRALRSAASKPAPDANKPRPDAKKEAPPALEPELAAAPPATPSLDAPSAAPAKRTAPEAEPSTRADRAQEASRGAAPRQEAAGRESLPAEDQNAESKAKQGDQLSALGYVSGGSAGPTPADRSSAATGGLTAPSGGQADAWELADAEGVADNAPPPPPAPAPLTLQQPAPPATGDAAWTTAPASTGDFDAATGAGADASVTELAEAEEQQAPTSEPAALGYADAPAEEADLDDLAAEDRTHSKDGASEEAEAPKASAMQERSVPLRRARDRRGSRSTSSAPAAPLPPAPVPTSLAAAHPELVSTWALADRALSTGDAVAHRSLLLPLLSHADADVAVDAAVRLATAAMDRGDFAQADTDLDAVAGRQPGPTQRARYRVARRTLDSMNTPLQLDAVEPPITNTTEYE